LRRKLYRSRLQYQKGPQHSRYWQFERRFHGGWIKYARKIEEAGADALELNLYYLATDPAITASELETAMSRWLVMFAKASRSRWR